MKNLKLIDVYGKTRIYRPSTFSLLSFVPSSWLVGLGVQSCIELTQYARSAHTYMLKRISKRNIQQATYKALADKISFLASCGFPSVPLYKVLDAFAQAHSLQPLYRHHVAFCRGYVPVGERENPPVEFYFGTFGGGFAFYTEFSTRYRCRHLILLSSWWFLNGDVSNGFSESKMAMFENFCKYGELSIGS